MNLDRDKLDALLRELHEYAKTQDVEYGLPIHDANAMAAMREIVRESLA